MKVVSIEEKPKEPKSNLRRWACIFMIIGVLSFAKNVEPSARGEIEITDIHNLYREKEELSVTVIDGIWKTLVLLRV